MWSCYETPAKSLDDHDSSHNHNIFASLEKNHFDNYANPTRVQTREKNDVIHAPDGFQKYVAEEFPDLDQKTYESV